MLQNPPKLENLFSSHRAEQTFQEMLMITKMTANHLVRFRTEMKRFAKTFNVPNQTQKHRIWCLQIPQMYPHWQTSRDCWIQIRWLALRLHNP